MNIKTKIVSILAGFGLAAGGLVIAQQSASAHFDNADSAALCGGGYNLVWQGVNDAMALDVRRNLAQLLQQTSTSPQRDRQVNPNDFLAAVSDLV